MLYKVGFKIYLDNKKGRLITADNNGKYKLKKIKDNKFQAYRGFGIYCFLYIEMRNCN